MLEIDSGAHIHYIVMFEACLQRFNTEILGRNWNNVTFQNILTTQTPLRRYVSVSYGRAQIVALILATDNFKLACN